MRLLVVHQNFPGQFGHLVRAWASRKGWDLRALGRDTAPGLSGFDGLRRYRLPRETRSGQHPYLRQMEEAILHGQATARAMLELRQGGFTPDVILAHPGWGETLYAREVYPDARLIHLCEWYYQPHGADMGFDPEFPSDLDDRARIRTWNALHTLNLTQCDAAVSPTQWQRSRQPELFQSKISLQHEGIETRAFVPNSQASFTAPCGVGFKAGDPVITYVARNLEPYRGFHIFMRALERVQAEHKACHALIVGANGLSYGRRPPSDPAQASAANWREYMLQRVNLDPQRTHFLGRIPRTAYLSVLQVSAVHAYLTYPFVLSWSLLEAMACGTAIVASDTAPVREVLRHGENAQLVDFFDVEALAHNLLQALVEPERHKALALQARADAQRFSLEEGLRGYDELLGPWMT